MSKANTGAGRPAIIGEVLFDRFPDGTQVLGGAPFNVAWHLQGFGAEPLFVSRVGDDAQGGRVREAMAAWGMDPSGVETDPDHPTGAVDIHFSGSQHSFDIVADQAYDYISREQLAASLTQADPELIYQGTLIMRTEGMRTLLGDFLGKTDVPLFVDINLREPWWRAEDFPWLLKRARWLKVNDEELDIIADKLGFPPGDLDARAQRMQEDFAIELLVLTLGSKGARALETAAAPLQVAPEPAKEVVDTVGAGDAFASVSLLGLMQGWSSATTLKRAQQFASRIVEQRGATSQDRDMYAQLLTEWGSESHA